MSLEEKLSGWKGPSSNTEKEKQERTERMIRQAIQAHEPLSDCALVIFTKGSYANNTNVRADSDVDIAVECTECIYWEEEKKGAHPQNNTPYSGKWTPEKLRTEIIEALNSKFPGQVDTTGTTAIQINSSSSRVNADVVPCFSYKYYFADGTIRRGTKIFKSGGGSIRNYPKQQLEYGTSKNNRTNYIYKKVVRILKRVQNSMASDQTFRELPSYFIESLVFNCPDDLFESSTWTERVKSVLIHIWEELQGDIEPTANRWAEANDCLYLFHPTQKWTRKDGREFAQAAWNYLGLK
ncbi:nucleotidyltransferase [Vibrio parahaemolyticus]|nr:nucleotidyltransferase [Vibrio parahaemolyticus]EJU8945848.1 nucleotidyltransferase [Vibrio parahaemolyticus]ELS9501824.1 nucleotidyltransferase [Vibrio parahaemolyticus]